MHGGDIIGIALVYGVIYGLTAKVYYKIVERSEHTRIIVEFISVKCYNERAWEAKTASQALCVITEETGGNLS